jgi:hypothetical protein
LPHTFDKVVLDELFPCALDVWTVHDVLEKAATVKIISKPLDVGQEIRILVLR